MGALLSLQTRAPYSTNERNDEGYYSWDMVLSTKVLAGTAPDEVNMKCMMGGWTGWNKIWARVAAVRFVGGGGSLRGRARMVMQGRDSVARGVTRVCKGDVGCGMVTARRTKRAQGGSGAWQEAVSSRKASRCETS